MNWPIERQDGSLLWPKADPSSPYYCNGPTLISFSGGRTSAYMLWLVLCAHGGVLPDYVYVVFANTGKERLETLRFVYECGRRWGVHIWWLEWRTRPAGRKSVAAEERFEIVGFNSASRNGEPFAALIKRKGYLPNAVTRFCTAELKIDTMKQFMLSRGYKTWVNMVGLRADERKRVLKQVLRNLSKREIWVSYCPLALTGVIERAVWRFWLGKNKDPRRIESYLPQGFDLGLRRYEGNCDNCFLKAFASLCHQARETPDRLDWWDEQEVETGATFVTEYSFSEIRRIAAATPELVDWESLPGVGDCTETCAVDPNDEEPDPDDATMEWLFDQMRKIMAEPLAFVAPVAAPVHYGDLLEGL